MYSIGIDIGGSHISCAAIDLRRKIIISGTRINNKVDNKWSADEILNAWAAAIRNCIEKSPEGGLTGIGFAIPGPIDYEKGIGLYEGANNKYEKLYNVDIGNGLRSLLNLHQSVSIRYMNDASAFAVGEAWMGKAAGYRKSLAITLGTGFGSAFLENGIPIVKGENVPELGCVWHLKFKDSIADDYISSRWFTDEYEKKTGKSLPGVKEVAKYTVTDKLAKALFEEYGDNLAEILYPWVKKFGVEVIVMGGNISGAYNLFGSGFEKRLKDEGLSPAVEISELKEDAAIIGSARLMEEDFWEKIQDLLKFM